MLSVFSRFTPQTLIRLKLSVKVRFAVLSFTIFAIVSARLQKLKKISDKVFDRLVLGRSFCFILCNFYERQCECYA